MRISSCCRWRLSGSPRVPRYISRIEAVVRQARAAGLAYAAYVTAITVFNVPFALQVVGVSLSVLLLYAIGSTWRSSDRGPFARVVQLGNYSLFAYVAQIAALQLLRRGLRGHELTGAELAIPFVVALAITVLAVRRSRSSGSDRRWPTPSIARCSPDMVPRLARLSPCDRAFIVVLCSGRISSGADVEPISWVPLVWMFLAGSRWVSSWLNLSGPLELGRRLRRGQSRRPRGVSGADRVGHGRPVAAEHRVGAPVRSEQVDRPLSSLLPRQHRLDRRTVGPLQALVQGSRQSDHGAGDADRAATVPGGRASRCGDSRFCCCRSQSCSSGIFRIWGGPTTAMARRCSPASAIRRTTWG